MTPATLRTWHALAEIFTRPLFPRMRLERVLPVRFEKLDQLDPLLIGKTRTHSNVLQLALIVKKSEQQRSDSIPIALLVPTKPSHDAITLALMLDLEHHAFV